MSYLPPDTECRVGPRTLTVLAVLFSIVAIYFAVTTVLFAVNMQNATALEQEKLVDVQAQYDELNASSENTSSSSTSLDVVKAGNALATAELTMMNLYSTMENNKDAYNKAVLSAKEYLVETNEISPWITTSFNSSSDVAWNLITTCNVSSDKYIVAWELVKGDKEVYAYTTATYDSTSKKFSNFKIYMTSVGQKVIK